MSTTMLGQTVRGPSQHAHQQYQQPSIGLRMFAALMRHMPTEIRRVDMVWHALYRRLGGGTFAENESLDRRWPAGLQPGVRGRHHGQLMFLNLQDWSDRRAYFSGCFYQQDISRLLFSVLRPGDQYLDVGANIGMTALVAASRIGPTGRGLCFEPNPEVFARLSRHLEANGLTNFEAVPAALSDREGVAKLYLSGSHTGLGSLSRHGDAARHGEGGNKSVEVRTLLGNEFAKRLDASRPTVIKIDVEGYEVQAFDGMSSILDWPDVLVVAEVSDDMLRRAGHSRDVLHSRMQRHGLVPFAMRLISERWRKRLELIPLDGPQKLSKYDAVFVRPGSRMSQRVEPFLARGAQSILSTSP